MMETGGPGLPREETVEVKTVDYEQLQEVFAASRRVMQSQKESVLVESVLVGRDELRRLGVLVGVLLKEIGAEP